MIFVSVPKEIKEYEKKFIKNMTLRQVLGLLSAVVLGLLTYYICTKVMTEDIASYLVMIVVIPCFLYGYISIQDMHFEVYFRLLMKHYLHKQVIVYDNEINMSQRKDGEHVQKKKGRKRKIKEYE